MPYALPISRPHYDVTAHVRFNDALQHSILHKNVAESCTRAITEFGLIPNGFGPIDIGQERGMCRVK